MTPGEGGSWRRACTRRIWGAPSGRRRDDDLEREVADHVAFAEDELGRKGHAPGDAARRTFRVFACGYPAVPSRPAGPERGPEAGMEAT